MWLFSYLNYNAVGLYGIVMLVPYWYTEKVNLIIKKINTMNIFIRIILALIAFFAIIKYISPLLTPIVPPIGGLLVVLLLVGVVYWLIYGAPLVP